MDYQGNSVSSEYSDTPGIGSISDNANDKIYSIDKCINKKDNLDCKYHLQLSEVKNELKECHDCIISSPSKYYLDKYVELVTAEQTLFSIIAVAEYKDIKVGISNINVDLNNEMKTLLTKKISKMPIELIDWTSYVKAAINFTTAQSYGSQIESVYIRKNNYQKVSPSEERGDAMSNYDGTYMEVKFTVVSFPEYQYDIVQIRPHHDIDEYHVVAFNKDTDSTEFYLLTKEEMNEEIRLTGSSLAHGTSNNKHTLVNPEYAIRFKIGSDTHKRWQKYLKPAEWV